MSAFYYVVYKLLFFISRFHYLCDPSPKNRANNNKQVYSSSLNLG